MAKAGKRLGNATYVARGYGQVEPNHLSAPYNGEVYAMLPAEKDIDLLENGQFIKYHYSAGVCDFSKDATAGPWYMVYNEVKLYRDREGDADFAMIKDNYSAWIYSAVGQNTSALKTVVNYTDTANREGTTEDYRKEIESINRIQKMPEGSVMTPRVIKISIGDHYTTNTIMADPGSLAIGDMLKIGDDGYLTKGTATGGDLDPAFVVVKVYTMPDLQPGVKIQRVK